MKATLLKVTGEIIEISPVNGTCFTLKEAQDLVHGYVQVIDMCPDKIMIVDEEGKFNSELNIEATRLALSNRAIFPNDYIAGDAILCDVSMF